MERVVVVDRRETGGSDDSGHRTRPLRWESVRDRWLSPSQRDQWAVNMASSRRFGLALAVVIAVLVVQPLRPFVGVGVFLLAAVMCLIARQLLEVTRQIRLLNEANVGAGGELWGLLGLIGKPGRLLPRLGGAGMDLEAAYALMDLVIRTRPAIVVELGPGASTVLLGLAGGSFTATMDIWSLEDDHAWLKRAERLVGYHSIPRCRIVSAPLINQQIGGWTGSWYSPEAVARIPDRIDLLIVDGPSNVEQRNSRYPAYPALRARLAPGSNLFVHDTNRADESHMVAQWLEDRTLQQEACGLTFVVLRHERPNAD